MGLTLRQGGLSGLQFGLTLGVSLLQLTGHRLEPALLGAPLGVPLLPFEAQCFQLTMRLRPLFLDPALRVAQGLPFGGKRLVRRGEFALPPVQLLGVHLQTCLLLLDRLLGLTPALVQLIGLGIDLALPRLTLCFPLLAPCVQFRLPGIELLAYLLVLLFLLALLRRQLLTLGLQLLVHRSGRLPLRRQLRLPLSHVTLVLLLFARQGRLGLCQFAVRAGQLLASLVLFPFGLALLRLEVVALRLQVGSRRGHGLRLRLECCGPLGHGALMVLLLTRQCHLGFRQACSRRVQLGPLLLGPALLLPLLRPQLLAPGFEFGT